jgi:hypothetical protein
MTNSSTVPTSAPTASVAAKPATSLVAASKQTTPIVPVVKSSAIARRQSAGVGDGDDWCVVTDDMQVRVRSSVLLCARDRRTEQTQDADDYDDESVTTSTSSLTGTRSNSITSSSSSTSIAAMATSPAAATTAAALAAATTPAHRSGALSIQMIAGDNEKIAFSSDACDLVTLRGVQVRVCVCVTWRDTCTRVCDSAGALRSRARASTSIRSTPCAAGSPCTTTTRQRRSRWPAALRRTITRRALDRHVCSGLSSVMCAHSGRCRRFGASHRDAICCAKRRSSSDSLTGEIVVWRVGVFHVLRRRARTQTCCHHQSEAAD